MFCYNCGYQLSEEDFCTSCGADVSLYKKIIYASNRFYNDGLAKAKVRDLSGAVNSLRQSLKLNKENIEARNLLGLIYFEMGEVVGALSEWVISKNMRPKKNVADNYIEMVQSNAGRLDTINQTIKKYNQAYYYCTQGSKDLAVIQLKKVLSMNPRFLRAHQLLALLYMDSEQWERAQREIRRCLEIDKNNTIALNYLKEVENALVPDDTSKTPVKGHREDSVRYQTDNEIIIQPLNVKEPKKGGLAAFFNIALGMIIGLAAMYFLVVPSMLTNERNQANQKINEIDSKLDDKTATIVRLEQQIKSLENDKEQLKQEIQFLVGEDGTLDTIDSFLRVVSSYMETKDALQAGNDLENFMANVDISQTSEALQQLYQTLIAEIGPQLGKTYYDAGMEAINSRLYEEAILNLSKAVSYDPTHVEALYELGNAYRENGDIAEAIAAYESFLELFPNSNHIRRVQGYLEDLTEE